MLAANHGQNRSCGSPLRSDSAMTLIPLSSIPAGPAATTACWPAACSLVDMTLLSPERRASATTADSPASAPRYCHRPTEHGVAHVARVAPGTPDDPGNGVGGRVGKPDARPTENCRRFDVSGADARVRRSQRPTPHGAAPA